MGMTEGERSIRRQLWRRLVDACAALDHVAIEAVGDVLAWSSVFEGKGPSGGLFALARLATGYRRGTLADRQRLAPALQALAAACAAYLDDAAPSATPPPRPFRADLDG